MKVFLEYEDVHAIDDIVVFAKGNMRAVQAKYAVDPLAVYVPDDFIQQERETKIFFGRYAQAWQKAREAYSGTELTVELVSNRGRDSTLEFRHFGRDEILLLKGRPRP